MTNLIWHRDQQSDIIRKGDLAYKCWRSGAMFPDGAKLLFGTKVFIPADIAPDTTFLTDSMIANLKAIAAERIGP